MNDDPRSTGDPVEPAADPVTMIGLVYRVLDRPHRTAGLIAVLALLLGAATELAHAPVFAGLSPGMWGVVISGASTVVAGLRSGWQKWTQLRRWLTRKPETGRRASRKRQ
jgi:hypothetical protein